LTIGDRADDLRAVGDGHAAGAPTANVEAAEWIRAAKERNGRSRAVEGYRTRAQPAVTGRDLPDFQVSAARNVERAGQAYGPVGATEQETGAGQVDGIARRGYRRIGVARGRYIRGGAC